MAASFFGAVKPETPAPAEGETAETAQTETAPAEQVDDGALERAEKAARGPLREQFDVATSRAVGALDRAVHGLALAVTRQSR